MDVLLWQNMLQAAKKYLWERMNEKAKDLGMKDSHFVNTNGLPVADHYSSAYDIALMSKGTL